MHIQENKKLEDFYIVTVSGHGAVFNSSTHNAMRILSNGIFFRNKTQKD